MTMQPIRLPDTLRSRKELPVMTFRERYGPWALVTGASSGIGAEFARQLSDMGLNLVLVARRRQRLENLARELESKQKIQARIVAADLSRPDFLPLILSATESIDVGLLINNAGFGIAGGFLRHDLESELALLDVNCRAPLILSHTFGRQMAERKRGGIIFVSSVSGYIATPFEASYAASKVYELFLAESLGYELRRHGVQVLALCPGSTATEFHEIAGSSPVAAMRVQPVVATALKQLGKKPVAITGWHNRLLVYILKFTPRRLQTLVAGRVMGNLVMQ
jgi:short-subunit dehydrogenase